MPEKRRDQAPATGEQPMQVTLEETLDHAEDELETVEQQDLEDKEPQQPRHQRG